MTAQKPIPAELLLVINFLRNTSESEFRLRQGFLNGKRVEFFKGKHAVNALLREPYRKDPKRPTVADRSAGEAMISSLLDHHVFAPASKEPKSQKLGLVPPGKPFDEDDYYVWVYEGSQLTGTLIGVGILLLTFAGVMFPLWPEPMRQGVYYLSLGMMGLIGALMAIAVLRLIIWVVLLLVIGQGGWLFPNLWADVGIIESFMPLWGWDEKKKIKGSKSS
ncbi:hypothetical protein BATDEDRAFT_34626 [Batrachochytrium dendrobatidis JAM81]|uniref:Translocation protein SEC62 n=2 Tax=Batrachochytrium dendrobatidis TaxID=109871 RepID=F4NXL7_BATDJ|nr:Sec63 complex subunit SEC62 [Batrachochytrium dendrobatidis JAM81]EGF82166.1 hypothetical protein BATDEDRAFT_34626 [Batrachochytrium dendrobatidis JAM81]|eukprot:XP_006677432.1 hypothetical protein BATDEDRAFT_34626 [Batrachochytrium dendrobatidis JAM81]